MISGRDIRESERDPEQRGEKRGKENRVQQPGGPKESKLNGSGNQMVILYREGQPSLWDGRSRIVGRVCQLGGPFNRWGLRDAGEPGGQVCFHRFSRHLSHSA